MRIHELIKRTGISERQVRYLISEGLMPRPTGGRSNAEYGEDHVLAIERYTRLRELGFPPAAIKLLLEASAGAPFPVVSGITLVVEPQLIATGAPVEPLVERIRNILTDVMKEPSNGNVRDTD